RAFEAAANVAAPRSVELGNARPLAVAALGYEVVRALFAAGDNVGAEETLREVSPALALVGAFERITELENIIRLEDAGSGRALIGAVLPLTGDARRVGRTVMAGILQAQGAFFPGGGRRLTVVFKDSGSTPEGAAAAVESLDTLGVLAIIGP